MECMVNYHLARVPFWNGKDSMAMKNAEKCARRPCTSCPHQSPVQCLFRTRKATATHQGQVTLGGVARHLLSRRFSAASPQAHSPRASLTSLPVLARAVQGVGSEFAAR
eukprot:scaffold8862_cov122-Isochrysis_galbana.AAC.3